jgi:hypothetical protein
MLPDVQDVYGTDLFDQHLRLHLLRKYLRHADLCECHVRPDLQHVPRRPVRVDFCGNDLHHADLRQRHLRRHVCVYLRLKLPGTHVGRRDLRWLGARERLRKRTRNLPHSA